MDFIQKDKKFDLISFGEVMLRLSPPDKEKISQGQVFEKNAGGSELNVASGAAFLGVRSAIITKLPDNKIGRFITAPCERHMLCMMIRMKKDLEFIILKAEPIQENLQLYMIERALL